MEPPDLDRYVGSMLGLALGDAIGAWHEGGLAGKVAWWLVGLGQGSLLRYSDDTQMAIGLAESLIEKRAVDPDHLARRWAELYEFSRGYGPGTRRILQRIRSGEDWRELNRLDHAEGSLGNGAAMRAAPIGLFYHGRPDELRGAAEAASVVTHAHALGIEGGVLIARAVSLALSDGDVGEFLKSLHGESRLPEFRSRLELARAWLPEPPPPEEVRRSLGNSVKAHESAVTAIYAYARHSGDFSAMMEFILELGGDTDTIGAMAGGIFGARKGTSALPPEPLSRLEARDELEVLGRKLYEGRRQ